MKAAYIEKTGPSNSIIIGELPTPAVAQNQVLVKVGAAALNPIDTYVRSGAVAMELPMPFVVGCDLAGTVEAVGSDVTRFKLGDRVWGSNQGLLGRQGTFAQFAAVDEKWLYPTPEVIDDVHSAAMALVGITAHLGLVRDAKLQAGETIFVNGGTGGVASSVIQMAKAIGAHVVTTAGSEAKAERCKTLGADHVILYKKEDVTAAAKAASPDGYNVWFETTREPNFHRAIELLQNRGRIILIAGRDAAPPLPVGPFYVKECRLFGFVMFLASHEEQQATVRDINLWQSEGKLRPQIDRVVRLEETPAMHKLQEREHA